MRNNKGLIMALTFTSVIISGSLVFFGMQFTATGEAAPLSEEVIEKGIERYVAKQQEQQLKEQGRDAASKNELAKNVTKVDTQGDHIRGNANAQVSLIEYSDFECPFCKRFHDTANKIVDEYDGDVNWIYRHYPLGFHDPLATKEAIATECANELGGNDKFWEMTDLLFERTSSNGNGLDVNNLPEFAAEIGIDKSSFSECLESGKYDAHIAQEIQEGSAAGVSGTPGNIIINNQTGETVLVEGAQPFESFKPVIDQMLNS